MIASAVPVAVAAALVASSPAPARVAPASAANAHVAERAAARASTAEFVDEAGAVTERVSDIGRSVRYWVSNAASYTDAELADRFRTLAGRCAFAGQKLNELDPPTRRAKRKVAALSVALRAVRKDLQHIADAAKASDPDAAGAATRSLVDHSPAVARANRALKAEIRRLRDS